MSDLAGDARHLSPSAQEVLRLRAVAASVAGRGCEDVTAAFGVSLKAVDARVSGPAGSYSRRSARPPGQVSLMTRWVVALLEGVRTAGATVVRAPSRARTSCGAFVAAHRSP